MDHRTRRDLTDLLAALLDGALTAAEEQQLKSCLEEDPEARQLYLDYLELHADLALRGGIGTGPDLVSALEQSTEGGARKPAALLPTPDLTERESSGWPAWAVRLLRSRHGLGSVLVTCGLAASIALLLLTIPKQSHKQSRSHETVEASDDTVAVLLQAPGAEWEDSGLPTRPGTPLSPGWLRLKSGFAHVEFYSGATVILQAPAELKLISRTEAYCARGKLRAMVPPHAQGFTIGTPRMDVVDRGTEFGLDVRDTANAEVHVFQGKVELYEGNGQRAEAVRRELVRGQGLRLDGPGAGQPIPSASNEFRTAREVAAAAERVLRQRREAWLAASEAIQRDPTLLVYYPCQGEEQWSRTLRNRGAEQDPERDGAIIGCTWTTGRWPGKDALEFKQVSDRVRLHVAEELESLTLIAWVRVETLANVNNSLFMTDTWQVGGVHWQIGEGGKLVLGIRAPAGLPNGHYHALEVFNRERLGHWVQLAVVYDRDHGQVVHFVDGRVASRTPIAFDVPLKLGNAELGNWNNVSKNSRQPIRFFRGSMDEFMLFSRALADEEIERLYQQGRPAS